MIDVISYSTTTGLPSNAGGSPVVFDFSDHLPREDFMTADGTDPSVRLAMMKNALFKRAVREAAAEIIAQPDVSTVAVGSLTGKVAAVAAAEEITTLVVEAGIEVTLSHTELNIPAKLHKPVRTTWGYEK